MNKQILSWLRAHWNIRWCYPVLLIISVALFAYAAATGNDFKWGYLSIAVVFLFAIRPGSLVHAFPVENTSLYKKLCSILVAAATIAACVLPMSKLPLWNGEIPEHRDQYERMAESFLEGRIDFAYGDEDALAGLENPYDYSEREEAGVEYHWDHAYYDGHYYMYFGVVPVLLVFLPYRILTGTALTTYHATQIFVAFAVAGIFALFHLLAKLFFRKLPCSVYLALAAAFSVMSVWYSVAEPALYCTAITSAIALEVWSLYFFIRAVWGEQEENRQLLLAGIGAMLGALVFGCRPPIALANILVVPMLIVFLKQRKFTWKLLGKLVLAALPYVIVAAALMLYNYARFDDPFEFGQTYQLTVADQSQYRITLNAGTILRLINNTMIHFFNIGDISGEFPYIPTRSVFYNFPVLLLCVVMFKSEIMNGLRQSKLLPLMICLFLTVLIITASDIMWSPRLLERYRMDIYFLMGIGCFVVIGMWYNTCSAKRRACLSSAAVLLSAATVISAFLLCVHTMSINYPEKVDVIANALHLP